MTRMPHPATPGDVEAWDGQAPPSTATAKRHMSASAILLQYANSRWARQHGRMVGPTDVSQDDKLFIQECFASIDIGQLGVISIEQIGAAIDKTLGPGCFTDAALQHALRDMDHNGDGTVDWPEFKTYMARSLSPHQADADVYIHSPMDEGILVLAAKPATRPSSPSFVRLRSVSMVVPASHSPRDAPRGRDSGATAAVRPGRRASDSSTQYYMYESARSVISGVQRGPPAPLWSPPWANAAPPPPSKPAPLTMRLADIFVAHYRKTLLEAFMVSDFDKLRKYERHHGASYLESTTPKTPSSPCQLPYPGALSPSLAGGEAASPLMSPSRRHAMQGGGGGPWDRRHALGVLHSQVMAASSPIAAQSNIPAAVGEMQQENFWARGVSAGLRPVVSSGGTYLDLPTHDEGASGNPLDLPNEAYLIPRSPSDDEDDGDSIDLDSPVVSPRSPLRQNPQGAASQTAAQRSGRHASGGTSPRHEAVELGSGAPSPHRPAGDRNRLDALGRTYVPVPPSSYRHGVNRSSKPPPAGASGAEDGACEDLALSPSAPPEPAPFYIPMSFSRDANELLYRRAMRHQAILSEAMSVMSEYSHLMRADPAETPLGTRPSHSSHPPSASGTPLAECAEGELRPEASPVGFAGTASRSADSGVPPPPSTPASPQRAAAVNSPLPQSYRALPPGSPVRSHAASGPPSPNAHQRAQQSPLPRFPAGPASPIRTPPPGFGRHSPTPLFARNSVPGATHNAGVQLVGGAAHWGGWDTQLAAALSKIAARVPQDVAETVSSKAWRAAEAAKVPPPIDRCGLLVQRIKADKAEKAAIAAAAAAAAAEAAELAELEALNHPGSGVGGGAVVEEFIQYSMFAPTDGKAADSTSNRSQRSTKRTPLLPSLSPLTRTDLFLQ